MTAANLLPGNLFRAKGNRKWHTCRKILDHSNDNSCTETLRGKFLVITETCRQFVFSASDTLEIEQLSYYNNPLTLSK